MTTPPGLGPKPGPGPVAWSAAPSPGPGARGPGPLGLAEEGVRQSGFGDAVVHLSASASGKPEVQAYVAGGDVVLSARFRRAFDTDPDSAALLAETARVLPLLLEQTRRAADAGPIPD